MRAMISVLVVLVGCSSYEPRPPKEQGSVPQYSTSYRYSSEMPQKSPAEVASKTQDLAPVDARPFDLNSSGEVRSIRAERPSDFSRVQNLQHIRILVAREIVKPGTTYEEIEDENGDVFVYRVDPRVIISRSWELTARSTREERAELNRQQQEKRDRYLQDLRSGRVPYQAPKVNGTTNGQGSIGGIRIDGRGGC